jgi:hypothetical protein
MYTLIYILSRFSATSLFEHASKIVFGCFLLPLRRWANLHRSFATLWMATSLQQLGWAYEKPSKSKQEKDRKKTGETWKNSVVFWSTDPILENSRVELSNDEQWRSDDVTTWTVNGTVRHGWPKPRTAPRWPSGCSSSARASAANALEIEIEILRVS